MADEPVAAWREPLGRRARRWAAQNRTAVTGAAAALYRERRWIGGDLGDPDQGQGRDRSPLGREMQANLCSSSTTTSLAPRRLVQARYDLAVEAIETFHTGVSEDFLLKQDQFKALRDRLLKSAQNFYSKLSAILGKETDREAQAGPGVVKLRAGHSDGEGRSQRRRSGRSPGSPGSATRRWPANPGSGTAATVDVARSLTQIAALLANLGRSGEALDAYRRSESLLAGSATTDTDVRAALASAGWGWARSSPILARQRMPRLSFGRRCRRFRKAGR